MLEEDLNTGIPIIDTRSLVDKVEFYLIDLFIRKKLNPGDTIPKELELANSLKVSRTVIRESLNRLKTMGLIESIKHKGTVIKSPALPEILQKTLIPNILDQSTLKDIFEMRLVIEVGMADLIVSRATDKDIEELYEIIRHEVSPSRETLFDIDHEVRFHGKLYAITGNQTLSGFQQLLLPVFNYAYSSGLIHRDAGNKHFFSHKDLVDVLKKRDAEQFSQAMRMHLENHYSRLFSMDTELS
ncbi:MAG: FCD domain-containing protein [Marinilabiliales bacterium]|nr:FCD domain-containing protein [Marinilabiliales bacterium]